MAVLGVAWAVCGIVVLTTRASGGTSQVFAIALFIIWFLVFLETAALATSRCPTGAVTSPAAR